MYNRLRKLSLHDAPACAAAGFSYAIYLAKVGEALTMLDAFDPVGVSSIQLPLWKPTNWPSIEGAADGQATQNTR